MESDLSVVIDTGTRNPLQVRIQMTYLVSITISVPVPIRSVPAMAGLISNCVSGNIGE